jgi:probable HAF family extracellular repeat protein
MSHRLIRWAVPIALTCLLLTASRTPAQEPQTTHHHYKLIDMGTLGGPGSTTTEGSQQSLDNRGILIGGADTPALDPDTNCFNPFNRPDCNVQHAFVWQHGVLTDLGTLPGGSSSFPYWINAQGVIAGGSELAVLDPNFGTPEFHAVFWENDKIHDLGTLGGTGSLSVGVNNSGQVTGFAQNTIPDLFSLVGLGTQTRAFLWKNGKMQDLGSLGGPDSFAQYINDSGQIAGVSFTSDIADPDTGVPPLHPFLWDNGTMKDLGNFGGTNGFLGPFVYGLNNRGQVIGIMSLPGEQFNQAFLWDGEKLVNLGTLGGNFSLPTSINNAGDVVGGAWFPGDQTKHAFLWRNGIMTDLGTVDGDPCSFAESINSKGQVVGASQSTAGGCDRFTAGFLWENGGPSVDLNTLVPPGSPLQLSGAAWINDRGEIAGGGVPPGCDNGDVCGHAVLLIPCDENHPDLEGCDYSMVGAETSAEARPEQSAVQPQTAAKLSPAEVLARFRALIARRNRRYGMPQTFNTASDITNIEPAPTNLTSFAFRRGLYDVVELSWTDHSTNADSYHVERCTGATCVNFSAIAVTGGSAAHYIDSMWPMHLTFRYRVRDHGTDGYSGYSNIRTQATP